MKILHFPSSRPTRPRVAQHLASLETLLSACLESQSTLRADGRRLKASLARLTLLTGDMMRRTEHLRLALGRLRACRDRAIPPAARG